MTANYLLPLGPIHDVIQRKMAAAFIMRRFSSYSIVLFWAQELFPLDLWRVTVSTVAFLNIKSGFTI